MTARRPRSGHTATPRSTRWTAPDAARAVLAAPAAAGVPAAPAAPATSAAPTAPAAAFQVIVTRPRAQALDWVARLRAHAIDALALPLIEVAAADTAEEQAGLTTAWQALDSFRMVLFVSPNAVTHFFARRPAGAGCWPPGALAGSPGPGTTRALRDHGVPAAQLIEPPADAPQFDSEALWHRLRALDWQGARVLLVRGDGGREWLADTLARHGAVVDRITAYRRRRPGLDRDQLGLLHAAVDAPARFVWCFSSSEAIDNLVAVAESLSGPGAPAGWRAATAAIATHPRIAERAAACGFVRVVRVRPAFREVVACIQSLRPE